MSPSAFVHVRTHALPKRKASAPEPTMTWYYYQFFAARTLAQKTAY